MRDSGRPSNLLFRASQVGLKRFKRWAQQALGTVDRLPAKRYRSH